MIQASIWKFLEKAQVDGKGAVPFMPNRAKVGDVMGALGATCQLDSNIEAPAWLDHCGTRAAPSEFFACRNGLLHLATGEMHAPTPEFFGFNASDVSFDPTAPPPHEWLGFLEQLFGADREAIELLQEWFGYLLSSDTSQQKILLMVGPRRSGKGTIARVLTKIWPRVSGGSDDE